VVQRTDVSIEIGGHEFAAEAAATLYDGWMVFYKPYVNFERRLLPEMQVGDLLENLGIEMDEKFTQPLRRYNQSSLLEKMEQEKIGTKATRAEIIATLFKRKYIASSREGIEVTDLGLAVIESMKENAPSIISTDLTREMEEQLEKLELGDEDAISVIEPAVDGLVKSLSAFIEKEKHIGARIGAAAAYQREQAATIGNCPICKNGQLRIITSWKTKKRFVGCSNYSQAGCRASAPLPRKGTIRTTGKSCGDCGWPIVGIVFARSARPWRICVNLTCPSRKK
jgi:DNA topoisomerase-1